MDDQVRCPGCQGPLFQERLANQAGYRCGPCRAWYSQITLVCEQNRHLREQLAAADPLAAALALVLTDVLVSAHAPGCTAGYGYPHCRCGWPRDRAEIEAALAAWRQRRGEGGG